MPDSRTKTMDQFHLGADNFDGEGYDEEFDPPLDSTYECPICLLVLREPQQTTCGHIFCRRCILKTIGGGRPKCPIDNAILTSEDLFPDNFTKRVILKMKTWCRNHRTKGCVWKNELRLLQAHLEECPFHNVICPGGCGLMIERQNLPDHLDNICAKRLITCTYCKIESPFDCSEAHKEICLSFPVPCPNNCSNTELTRGEVDAHMAFCDNVTVFCPFKEMGCSFQDKRSMLAEHINMELNNHLVVMCKRVNMATDVINRQMQPMAGLKDQAAVFRKLSDLDAKLTEAEKRFNDLNSTAREVLTLQESNQSQVVALEQRMTGHLNKLTERVDGQDVALTELNARLWNGLFVWCVDGIDTMLERARKEEVLAIHSLPFYTTHPGYKMCLRLNVGGVDSESGNHLALFVHMMRGEFDGLLPWPFTGRFMLTIVDQADDQRERQNISEVLVASSGLQAFTRPTTPRNHKGYGYVEMVMHETLQTRNYIKNGKLVIRVNAIVNSV